MVDCSIGTPCDPPPPGGGRGAVVVGERAGLPGIGREPGAASGRRGVAGAPLRARRRSRRRRWRPAWAPRSWWPRCPSCSACASPIATPCSTRRCPTRPTPWGPRWPVAGPCRCRRSRARSGASTSVPSPSPTPPAPSCCGPTRPSNPTGGLGDLAAEAAWGRARGVPVFSDECYAEFTWAGPPRSVLQTRLRRGGGRPLALQALEPGRRAGGLLRRRPRAGGVPRAACAATPASWCPGRPRPPAAVALADDAHVEVQRGRYRERLTFLAEC